MIRRRPRQRSRPCPSPFLARSEEPAFAAWLSATPHGWRPHSCADDRLARVARGWRPELVSLWSHCALGWRREYAACPGRADDLLRTWRRALDEWRARQAVAA